MWRGAFAVEGPLADRKIPEPGDIIADRMIMRFVGEGAMGVVFEVRDEKDASTALKLLKPEKAENPESLREFVNEAEATGSVDHENVVTVLRRGEDRGWHFIEMEFVDGPPLHRLLGERGALPWQQATEIALDLARALGAAHDMGLVHRDVKPDNVLLTKEGRARLTDFGIVKDISSLKGYLLKGRKVGTALYASPEQCLDKRLDAATDMYSLGATVYHMVCGRPPFSGSSPSAVMNKHVKAALIPPVKRVPDLPKSLSNAIEKMMAKKQTDRYPSMARLAEDLEMILSGKVAIAAGGPRVDLGSVGGLKRSRRPAKEAAEKPKVPAELIIVIALLAVAAVFVLLMLLK
jgi:serine/threonine-protein kinase